MALHGSTSEGTFMTELGFPIEITLQLEEENAINFDVDMKTELNKDYDGLVHKPLINGVTLSGNKTSEDLGIATKTSELINDAGFISSQNLIFYCGTASEVV